MLFRLLTIVMLASSLAPMSAQADWSASQIDEFATSCVDACKANPKVHPSRHAECAAYCRCVSDESRGNASTIDYAGMTREMTDGIDSERLKIFRSFFPLCQTRVFGK